LENLRYDLMQTKFYHRKVLLKIKVTCHFWWKSSVLNLNKICEIINGIHKNIYLWPHKN
jgi:hypothetical protein